MPGIPVAGGFLKISGFTIARNAVRFAYPLEASIRSLLPLVDELVVALGDSDDGTADLVAGIKDSRILVVPTVWDMSQREAGKVLSQQTNLALERCSGDWGLYLQADEVLHEDDLPALKAAMRTHLEDGTEGLLLRYRHFYGSFRTIQDHPRKWYTVAVRAIRLGLAVESWGDALGFRMRLPGGRVRDLRTARAAAAVHHYGWVRPPHVMLEKQRNLDRFYHDEEWLSAEYREREQRVRDFYADRGNLIFFTGSHPKVMAGIVAKQDWNFEHGIEKQRPDWLRHLYIALFYRFEVRLRKLRVRLRRLWDRLRRRG
ncbi:MAG: glycosyltransferase family 2 protein [bacterium]